MGFSIKKQINVQRLQKKFFKNDKETYNGAM